MSQFTHANLLVTQNWDEAGCNTKQLAINVVTFHPKKRGMNRFPDRLISIPLFTPLLRVQ